MSDNLRTCAYCGEETDASSISEHVLNCTERPEVGLLLKIQALEVTGDVLLETIHRLVKALAEIEGMRSQAWRIYREAEQRWEGMKNMDAQELAKVAREDFTHEQEESEDVTEQ